MSIANNHIWDFGKIGVDNTLKTLDNNGIQSAGIASKPTTIFTKDGVAYGFIALCQIMAV